MKCVICKQGQTQQGKTAVTLDRGYSTVIIKDLHADICENCGEYYLSEEVTQIIQGLAEQAVEHGVEIEVLRFAA